MTATTAPVVPGPTAVDVSSVPPRVRCRLCAVEQVVESPEEGDDLAHDHVVAAHPEVEEP